MCMNMIANIYYVNYMTSECKCSGVRSVVYIIGHALRSITVSFGTHPHLVKCTGGLFKMKLVVIAALIAACTAARLEHLERSYLPPDNSIIPSKHSSSRDFGSSFDLGSSFGQHQGNPQNSFPSASNRYLPPTKGASNDATQFIGSVKGFGGQRDAPNPNQQYSSPSMSYGTPQPSTGRSQSQFGAANRQYLAPVASRKQNSQLGAPSRQYLTPNAGASQNGNQQFGSSSQYQQFGAAAGRVQNSQLGSAASRQYLAPLAGGSQSDSRQQFGGSNAGGSQIDNRQQFGGSNAGGFQSDSRQQFGGSNAGGSQSDSRQQFGGSSVGGSHSDNRQQFSGASVGGSKSNSRQQFGGSGVGQQQRFETTPSRQYLTPQANSFPSNGNKQSGVSDNSRFGSATNRQYLAPGFSGSQGTGNQKFAGSTLGQQQFRSSNSQYFGSDSEQFNAAPRFGAASRQLYLAPHASGLQKSRFQAMIGSEGLAGSSRQYLAPRFDSFEGVPQQAFNERTGYQY
ncbi:unnamed protein product [Arctia plantaginis]|uniref:Uncharacterized protein n=1 Tax=Arctia plantaginis TaxID=874455 RepID=A0A8S0Z800_ARCPL|nr:unnamed protein product [Arctia plantaginis]